ncbi:hypothetical protein D3C72_1320750 [compost metagenome]
MRTTRTSSSYFSPNSAMAPADLAASRSITWVTTSWLARIWALTSSSTRRMVAMVRPSKWEKSKRMRSAPTREPFWVT